MIKTSIIESFSLGNGCEVYVQASSSQRIALSFDGSESQYGQYLTLDEAIELASKLNLVVGEAALNGSN